MAVFPRPFQGWTLVVLVAVGCNAGPSAEDKERMEQRLREADTRHDLRRIHDAYMAHYKETARPARKAEDLRERIPDEDHDVLDIQKYGIVWGLDTVEHLDDDENTILAYEVAAPTDGGQVVMLDGTVKYVSASEFQQVRSPRRDRERGTGSKVVETP